MVACDLRAREADDGIQVDYVPEFDDHHERGYLDEQKLVDRAAGVNH